MRTSRILACALSFLGVVAADALAGINTWTLHGPQGGGGATYPVAVHPTNGSIVLTATSRGVFRSTNSGQSWTLVANNTLNILSQIVFDPAAPNRVIASDGQIYLSDDAGLTFAVAQGPVAANQVSRIALGPNSTLYAGINVGRLFRSVAPFSTWTEITTLPWIGNTNPFPYPQMIAVDPGNAQIVYVAIQDYGLYRTADGGQNWTHLSTLASGIVTPTTFTHLAFDPADSTRLVLSTGGGIYLSTNSGTTWSRRDTQPAYWVGFDRVTPGVLAATRTYDLARSTNNGVDWIAGANLRANNMSSATFVPGSAGRLLISSGNGIAISTDGGATGEYSLTGLMGVMPRKVVAAQDGTVLAAMASGRSDIFRRSGAAYAPLSPQALEAAIPFNRTISVLAVAPGNSQRIIAVNQGTQLVRTFDGGANWTAPHPVFTTNPGDYIIDVQIDPNDPDNIYVGRSISGLWATGNGGITFARYVNSPVYITGIGISPHDRNTVFVGGGANSNGAGIWKSTNGGISWTEQLPTTGGNPIISFAFHPTNANTVYGAGWSGVWRTTDGGSTWTRMVFPSAFGGTDAVASAVLFDPLIPTTLTVVGTVNSPGLLRSVDAGATWESVPMNLAGVTTQFFSGVLDAVNPSTVIAATTGADMAEYQVAPNLELSATALSLPLPVSSNVSITYTVTNRGPHASSASELEIDFPAWLTPSVPANCVRNGAVLTCQLAALRVDQSVSVPLTLAVGATPATTQVQINANLAGHEPDVVMANNSVTTSVHSAEVADVDVVFGGGATTFDRAQTSSVTATVSNSGPSPSTATQLVLQIPANLTASNIVAQGTCTTNAATITCNLGTLPASASTDVTFTVTGSAAGNGAVAATVQRAGIDPDDSHGATRDFVVRAIADLGVTVADSADPVTAGGAYQYTATVNNAGPDNGGVSSTITVTGATVTSATVNGGTCTNTATAATCTLTSLASGASAAITVNVNAVSAGTASASATVTFAGTDSASTNNSATASTAISAPPPPPRSGGGGGGRVDWLLAAMLALFAFRRVRLVT